MPRGRISALSLDFTRFEIVHAYRLPRHLRLSLGIWPLARLPLGETPAQTVTLRLQILLRCYGFSLDLLRVSKGRARKSRFVQSAVIQSPHLLAELPRFSVLQRRLHIEHSRVKNI